jgi:hypothetical protein
MELMKSVKDDMYLMAYGGDIVLLLRNIAVASTGEPSDLAKSCFREVLSSLLGISIFAIYKFYMSRNSTMKFILCLS